MFIKKVTNKVIKASAISEKHPSCTCTYLNVFKVLLLLHTVCLGDEMH